MTNETPAPSIHAVDDEAQAVDESTDPSSDEPTGDNGASDDHTAERKLRKRAQAAETERDQLRSSIEALQRHEVNRLVVDRLAEPSDLFTYGVGLTVADLADASGMIDAASVSRAVDALLDKRPGLAVAELKKPLAGTYSQAGQYSRGARSTRKSGWETVSLR